MVNNGRGVSNSSRCTGYSSLKPVEFISSSSLTDNCRKIPADVTFRLGKNELSDENDVSLLAREVNGLPR